MGSFLLKEEELEEEEVSNVSGVESFMHSDPKYSHTRRITIISTAIITTVLAITAFLLKPSPTPQQILIIPENTTTTESVVEQKEKHEDKKIYSYLQNIDVKKRSKYSLIDNERAISKKAQLQVGENSEFSENQDDLQNVNNPTKIEHRDNSSLTSQEKSSLEKIDDLIKSLVSKPSHASSRPNVQGTAHTQRPTNIGTQAPSTTSDKTFNQNIDKFIELDNGMYRIKLGTFETHSQAMSTVNKLYSSPALKAYIVDVPYYIIAVDDEIGTISYKVLLGNFKNKASVIELAQTMLSLMKNADSI